MRLEELIFVLGGEICIVQVELHRASAGWSARWRYTSFTSWRTCGHDYSVIWFSVCWYLHPLKTKCGGWICVIYANLSVCSSITSHEVFLSWDIRIHPLHTWVSHPCLQRLLDRPPHLWIPLDASLTYSWYRRRKPERQHRGQKCQLKHLLLRRRQSGWDRCLIRNLIIEMKDKKKRRRR